MPVKKSSIKALAVAERRTAENRRWKKRLTEATKAFAQSADKEKGAALISLQSLLDKAVKRQILHRNRAARLKSRYARLAATK